MNLVIVKNAGEWATHTGKIADKLNTMNNMNYIANAHNANRHHPGNIHNNCGFISSLSNHNGWIYRYILINHCAFHFCGLSSRALQVKIVVCIRLFKISHRLPAGRRVTFPNECVFNRLRVIQTTAVRLPTVYSSRCNICAAESWKIRMLYKPAASCIGPCI